MIMRVLAFLHETFEDLGRIAPALEAAELAWERIFSPQGWPELPPLDDIAGIVLMGGPMSANDDLPYLRAEEALIRRAYAGHVPLVGICLGAQLIARALGARVYPNPVKEIGWGPVYFTGEAQADPLLRGIAQAESVLHWHGETFDLPPAAVWLAWTPECRHQAFRCGAHCYGFQFHLEVTPEMVSDWCQQSVNQRDVCALPGPIDPHHNATRLAWLAQTVFGGWARLAKERAARHPA
jgi:GMP synthase-like glutamine amidotransferase